MRLRIFSLLALILIVALAGCSSGSVTQVPTMAPSSSGYPAPATDVVQTAYPAGTMPDVASGDALAATQDPNLGSVEGTLLIGGKPVANVTLYLGALVTDAQGRELVAGYDRASTLRATTDTEGHWKVYNVPEGRYGLILDIVSQAYLLDTPDGTQSVLLGVKNGETTQMGVLDYSELPGL